jgi:hypothetical protein
MRFSRLRYILFWQEYFPGLFLNSCFFSGVHSCILGGQLSAATETAEAFRNIHSSR